MHIRLIAVSDRQPPWVGDAFDDYVKRLPPQWQFRMSVIPTARRGGDVGAAVKAEGLKVLKQVRQGETVVLLDESGIELGSTELAAKLNDWQAGGSDLAFIIGGPDGVSPGCAERADLKLSLSRLTLPHGLARVVLAEQLYRSWALLQGHPYHRA